MNMGGIGRGTPTDAIKPMADVAQKAAKAGQIKSIKLKIKMKPKAIKEGPDAA
jgi:hypothetical protein